MPWALERFVSWFQRLPSESEALDLQQADADDALYSVMEWKYKQEQVVIDKNVLQPLPSDPFNSLRPQITIVGDSFDRT
jgi:hypothetical protein